MSDPESDAPAAPRSPAILVLIVIVGVLGCAGLAALGTWQLERRAWKLNLIQQVESRVHAAPVPAPNRAEWPKITAADHAYQRVRVTGVFLHDRETLVQAVTELGSGSWVLTPLRMPDGTVVLVNRGFVPPDRRDPATRQAAQVKGEITVTGLLRVTEPGGTLLQSNNPSANRWHSRDVTAIAAARGLTDVAPYFIDADAASTTPSGPVGGLTVIAFSNNHFVYAVTWYVLALMLAAGTVYVVRDDRRLREAHARQA